jgi:hypothetical protein
MTVADTILAAQNNTEAAGGAGATGGQPGAGNANPSSPAPEQAKSEQPNSDAAPDAAKPDAAAPEAAKPDADKPAGVPEVYDLKAPEESGLGEADIKAISDRARDLGLSQEQAQKLLDQEASARVAAVKAQQETWAKQVGDWESAVKADKDIGGDQFPATVKHCRLAVERFASPALKQALNETGFGNHPELVRCFAAIGKAMAEDTPINGKPTSGPPKSPAEILYPNT